MATSLAMKPSYGVAVPMNDRRPPDWGTGKVQIKEPIVRNPTFRYTNVPEFQEYRRTLLNRALNRYNDELVPRPQEVDIKTKMIDRRFPAEHPFASHLPKFAVFPSFAKNPDDPKLGVVHAYPRWPQMASAPDHQIAVNLSKGGRETHYIVDSPCYGCQEGVGRKPLQWPSDNYFQCPKGPGKWHPQYYPMPPQVIHPNLERRPASMSLSEKSVNALKNIEKDQWISDYKTNFAGFGTQFPNELDNYYAKMLKQHLTGVCDEDLKPHQENTVIRPVTVEGRYSKGGSAKGNGTKVEVQQGQPGFKESKQQGQPQRELEYWGNTENVQGFPAAEHNLVVDEELVAHKKVIQEMEARNRWEILNSVKPQHNIAALKRKQEKLYDHEQPKSFYDHMGKYVEERSDLYMPTNFNAKLMRGFLNRHVSSSAPFATSQSHVDALSHPTDLNGMVNFASQGSNTHPNTQPELASKSDAWDVFMPYYWTREMQSDQLQRGKLNDNVRMQEARLIQDNETEYGSKFNTRMFLQERELPDDPQHEPLSVMSASNQNLGAVLSAPKIEAVIRKYNQSPEKQHQLYGPLANATVEQDRILEADRAFHQLRMSRDDVYERKPMESKSADYQKVKLRKRYLAQKSPLTDAMGLEGQKSERDMWKPNRGVPYPQTKILDIQNNWNQSRARTEFHGDFPEDAPDLRGNIEKGKMKVALSVLSR